jgi:hypothetical protein
LAVVFHDETFTTGEFIFLLRNYYYVLLLVGYLGY